MYEGPPTSPRPAANVAEGYGVPSKAHAALEAAITSSKPELVEVPVIPGMALF
jgi:hypothetical protein